MISSMTEILDARERRVSRQQALLGRFQKSLICFTMNIPGPEKNSPLITRGFRLGMYLLEGQLSGSRIPVLHREDFIEPTGCEGYWVVDGNPQAVKALCMQVEDSLPVGRLFDMDVLGPYGGKVSRESLGFPGRRCLICEQPVYLCSRSRAHTLAQLQEKTRELLRQALLRHESESIGVLAAKSLMFEVCTTPKPGLVDRRNSGSHRDMDIFTFLSSTATLQPYFTQCARIGIETAQEPPDITFDRIRILGKCAETAMCHATDGVNTHKGAIFSMGILCAAAGRLAEGNRDPEAVCSQAAAMTAGLTARDMAAGSGTTTGEILFAEYGITGVRGQAEAGFPAILEVGLPVLEEGLSLGHSLEEAGCAVLLHLMCAITDTNLIARSDRQTQLEIQAAIAAILKHTTYPGQEILQKLDDLFMEKNLSPGGSADLLAATYFLYFLKKT